VLYEQINVTLRLQGQCMKKGGEHLEDPQSYLLCITFH